MRKREKFHVWRGGGDMVSRLIQSPELPTCRHANRKERTRVEEDQIQHVQQQPIIGHILFIYIKDILYNPTGSYERGGEYVSRGDRKGKKRENKG